ncbi:uncharacterized protein CG3556 [Nephila pilipes]|uniref:Uncharacterized protein CG3556 n=1 Tax=Nephila pilipes TaxID=299642 RepID=A0A8X6PKV1_NEPPI|nr:uncharacterized protein CG3556 [Nephila pilipes]
MHLLSPTSPDSYFYGNDLIKASKTQVSNLKKLHASIGLFGLQRKMRHGLQKADSDGHSRQRYRHPFVKENFECSNKDSFQCDDNFCIPRSKVCDGVKDCKNGSDEVGCEFGVLAIEGVKEARENAVNWLKNNKTFPWNWRYDMPRAVVALYLASDVNFNGTSLEEELMAKQVELKTALSLLRSSLTNSELSMFINALIVTCHNPRYFYGNDLIKRLKTQVEQSQNFTHPLAYLALCNANETWPSKADSDLNDILDSDTEYPFVKGMF